MATIPSTGPMSLSQLQSVFGGTNPISLSEYYVNANPAHTFAVPGIPSIGSQIRFSAFRGKRKATPPVWSGLPSQYISTNTASINLSSYISDLSGSLSYSITSNPYGNAYISGTTLYIPGANRGRSYSVTVRATNGYTLTASQSVSITEPFPPPVFYGLPSQRISTNTASINLSSYVSDSSGSQSYAITSNPYGNAYISGTTLYIPGANRGRSYSVTVRVTNASSLTASQSVSITELFPPPVFYGLPSQYISTNTASINLSSYVSDSSGSQSYSITGNPYGNAYISGTTLYIPGANRATFYYVTVSVTNASSLTASQSVGVTEEAPPPPPPSGPYVHDINGGWPYSDASGYDVWISVDSSGNGICYHGGEARSLYYINNYQFNVDFGENGTYTATIINYWTLHWNNGTVWNR
jgi:predicted RNA-binding protein with TRAM domain